MKVAIMQPYFLPYIGYFSLIKNTEQFILLDTVQFIRHGWIERNRILKQDNGWLYIKVPLVKASRNTLIKDMRINNSTEWEKKILAQLQTYKKRAPYYYEIIELLNKIFSQKHDSIVELNRISLKVICDYLEIPNNISIFSEMNLKIEQPNEPDEWALNICKELPYENIHYINPIGGIEFFKTEKYKQVGIEISFQNMKITEYNQKTVDFETGLSIIDVMMFNSVEEINGMLDKYELV